MKKEFGKLSAQQIRDFYEVFCEFIEEFADDLDDLPTKQADIKDYEFTWHSLYDLDMNMVTAHLLVIIGMDKEIKVGIEKGDPQQHCIDLMRSGYEPPVNKEDLDEQQLINLAGCLICLCNDLICFAAYRTDIHKLLKEAKRGHKESLFKAINIDQAVLSTSVASQYIAKATLENDGHFFDDLSKAVKGSYPRKPCPKYPELNFFVYLIEDALDGASMDYETLHELFTENIPLYPNVIESKDSFGSFKKQVERTRHTVKDIKS